MRGLYSALVIGSLALQAALAPATFASPPAQAARGVQAIEVRLDGEPLFSLCSPAPGGSTAQRVKTVERRLSEALAEGRTWEDVHVRRIAGRAAVYVGDRALVTVGAAEARRAGLPVDRLAVEWARRTRAVMSGRRDLALPEPGSGPVVRVAAMRQELDPDAPAEKSVPVYDATSGQVVGQGRVAGAASDVGLVRAIAVRTHSMEEMGATTTLVPVREVLQGTTQRRVYGIRILHVELTPNRPTAVVAVTKTTD